MALLFSKYTRGAFRTPAPQWAGQVVAKRFAHSLIATQNVTGNILDLGIIPANARVLDVVIDSDDLDSGSPAIVLDVGVMTGSPGEALDAAGNARTIGAEFFSASTIAQAGGVARLTLKTGFRVDSVAYDRSIGLKIATQSATHADGEIGVTVYLGTN